jgi:biotin synthase-related radical SAM superfamily protein
MKLILPEQRFEQKRCLGRKQASASTNKSPSRRPPSAEILSFLQIGRTGRFDLTRSVPGDIFLRETAVDLREREVPLMSVSPLPNGNPALFPIPGRPLNPAELKIDLLCRGVHLDDSPGRDDGNRPLLQPRAGLASGLELIILGQRRDLWVNAPVVEGFVGGSPYHLRVDDGQHKIFDERQDMAYRVKLAGRPAWYDQVTEQGIPMSRIGNLQGTCLSIYLGDRCHFWSPAHPLNCKFCTTALNLGRNEEEEKTVEDVVQTALAARKESRITFVHLNSGYQGVNGLKKAFPFVKALKERVGLLVGVQFTPEQDLRLYDQILNLGADHLSFCFEFYNAEYFRRYLPGKAEIVGRETFFKAMEYCARKMGKGRVSGEIIAGVEPIEDTFRAIEFIVRIGAFPMVCIFRPLTGADMENYPPPAFSDMVRVFRHVYETCRVYNLPIGIAPNVNVSLSLQPEDTFYLARGSAADQIYQRWIGALRHIMRPYFARRMRPHV